MWTQNKHRQEQHHWSSCYTMKNEAPNNSITKVLKEDFCAHIHDHFPSPPLTNAREHWTFDVRRVTDFLLENEIVLTERCLNNQVMQLYLSERNNLMWLLSDNKAKTQRSLFGKIRENRKSNLLGIMGRTVVVIDAQVVNSE
uniref:Uncharacterized protein n=1 Tax=Vespula pensylvanica TaxID=30213 RepID=A0A834U4M6_VESPE|nr:hypothetical protein H0235_012601 [Vespula pensylvanica]